MGQNRLTTFLPSNLGILLALSCWGMFLLNSCHLNPKVIKPRNSGSDSHISYIWQANDSIEEISKKFQVKPEVLRRTNGVFNEDDLSPGHEMKIPVRSGQAKNWPGSTYQTRQTMVWPVQGEIRSNFGMRRGGRQHHGIDIQAKNGTPIKAVADGKVVYAGWIKGYGKTVKIEHKNKLLSLYAHLSKILVKKNQPVRAGKTIALVGKTGRATGFHLHFELRENGHPFDPLYRLPPAPNQTVSLWSRR